MCSSARVLLDGALAHPGSCTVAHELVQAPASKYHPPLLSQAPPGAPILRLRQGGSLHPAINGDSTIVCLLRGSGDLDAAGSVEHALDVAVDDCARVSGRSEAPRGVWMAPGGVGWLGGK